MSRKYNSLDQLAETMPSHSSENLSQEDIEKLEYQKKWQTEKYQFREMVSKKNRKWLKAESENNNFSYQEPCEEVYRKIESYFQEEGKRKWLIHIITNFLPLSKAKLVPKLPPNKTNCPISNLPLTDMQKIPTGDRDKHIGFTGVKSNVILSAIALQELERFVLDCTVGFDTREGHIVNYAVDLMRCDAKNKAV